MKTIKTIISIAAVSALAIGCTGNFEKYNTDQYAVKSADPAILMPTMIEALMYVQQNDSQMVDQMVGTLGGYFTLSNRWGGQNFDTFNASDSWNAIPYETPFLDIYGNYFEIEKYTNGSGHYYAVATLVKAAAMMRVADCYGPIPYSKVQDGKMYVAYDSNEDVYNNIIADLRSASGVLYSYAVENSDKKPLGAQDALYGGDYLKWAKFANSLIMRAAMRIGSKEDFIQAYESPYGYIGTNSDNAMMDPKSQRNPYDLASESWGDVRVNSSIVDYMNGYSDPRAEKYFSKVGNRYVGMRSGKAEFDKSSVVGLFSMTNFDETSKLPVFVAAESKFLLAEAVLRGWISGDAKTFYEEGIRLSMEQWGVFGDVNAYITDATSTPDSHTADPAGFPDYTRNTDVKIAWETSGSFERNLEQIITQKWIANYPMGIEAWTEWRRTGYPELAPVIDNKSSNVITDDKRGMRRLRYSFNEKSLNRENYDAAVQMLGGTDNEAVDLFWAKKK
ncbi:MAG: SusD/RagB family nutrient-binding outer membrane lipoprotein [Bacteroidales bacterium]|nr:SusD/RagB family nutrient-binding outer membrane lipoprotein [Bacteroides sp.]MCM1197707.1 SusD/RagB family nutrient-binding outer membrane lipoprotein [Clostridium sp.]MCM1501446.1 SusD/RagB family nutrient-binding outer membrane lipoprotein [Bacteroidales bacterium]